MGPPQFPQVIGLSGQLCQPFNQVVDVIFPGHGQTLAIRQPNASDRRLHRMVDPQNRNR
jgi:hypothetical protein